MLQCGNGGKIRESMRSRRCLVMLKPEFLHWSNRHAGWSLRGERGSPRRDPFAIFHTLFLISASFYKERKSSEGLFSGARAYRRPTKSIRQIYQRRDHVPGELCLPMMRSSVSQSLQVRNQVLCCWSHGCLPSPASSCNEQSQQYSFRSSRCLKIHFQST